MKLCIVVPCFNEEATLPETTCRLLGLLRDLQAKNKIGTMLPCNVIVQEIGDGKVEVAAVDPIESMKAIENPALGDVAIQVRALLKKVVDNL